MICAILVLNNYLCAIQRDNYFIWTFFLLAVDINRFFNYLVNVINYFEKIC